MCEKAESNQEYLWDLVTEYRKRIKTYAWLLVVGIPGAFLAWHDKARLDLACLGVRDFDAAPWLAIVAQSVLLVLILQSLNLLIDYSNQGTFPEPVKRKRGARFFRCLGLLGFGSIAFVEFFHFAEKVSHGGYLVLSCIAWMMLWCLAYVSVEGGPKKFWEYLCRL